LLACDIFAFPSITRNEAFGISLAEAMFFGKPAVTFTIKGSGVNWVCPNGVAGLEAPNRDILSLARNIETLSCDKELYQRLSKNAKQRSEDLFSLSAFEKNVDNLYKTL
jgi:glycosyltransferase involved in cell wall biosynthesis